MHRATPADTLHRSYDAGGARATIEKVDDTSLMQTMTGGFMKSESRKDIEAPQNYGFTSVVRDASKKQNGQLNESAEGFITFLGGNRSIPILTSQDDRRYRLKELEKGDVAMFDYLQHQLHFNTDGMFMTGRTDKKVKIQLVPPPQDQSSSSSAGTRWIEVFDAQGRLDGYTEINVLDYTVAALAASSGASSSQSSGGQKKLKGQKKRYDTNNNKYLEMTNDTHNLVHDQNINHKAPTHQFMPPQSSGSLRTGVGNLVQIFGNKFTGGLGYFMQQVTAAPPTSPMHLATKGYIDSIINGLGFNIPSIPALPIPPLPPGITWPPGIPLPPGITLPTESFVEYPAIEGPRLVLDGGEF